MAHQSEKSLEQTLPHSFREEQPYDPDFTLLGNTFLGSRPPGAWCLVMAALVVTDSYASQGKPSTLRPAHTAPLMAATAFSSKCRSNCVPTLHLR